jgi:membrane protease YdiL (CAAX protease family)
MILKSKFTALTRAIICSLALMMFSYFIHYTFPVRLISFAALLAAAFIIGNNVKSVSDLKKITGGIPSAKESLLFYLIGLAGGILLAVLYRWYLDITLFPKYIFGFAFIAALIGSMEELVFRGYIQESVRSLNGPFSILLSSVSHTGYKCMLFMSPVIAFETHIGFLAFWTFLAGIAYGTIRHLTKSIWPSMIAHALFDILVYAEYINPPWWVW